MLFKIRKIKTNVTQQDIEYNLSIKKIYKFFITDLKVYDSFEIANVTDYKGFEHKFNRYFK
jgi:hypothetical protein